MFTLWQLLKQPDQETVRAIMPKRWKPKEPKPEQMENLSEIKKIMEGKPKER